MQAPYLDTSALAKWYLNERRSEEVEAFLRRQEAGAIGRLTVLEFRCLLARRRRAREITPSLESRVFSTFENHIRTGFLLVHPLEDFHALAAVDIVARLKAHPLRSLDALHLAIARSLGAASFATADRVMADAAEALGFQVVRFD
jgi:predicted nucleic acid-binding protein